MDSWSFSFVKVYPYTSELHYSSDSTSTYQVSDSYVVKLVTIEHIFRIFQQHLQLIMIFMTFYIRKKMLQTQISHKANSSRPVFSSRHIRTDIVYSYLWFKRTVHLSKIGFFCKYNGAIMSIWIWNSLKMLYVSEQLYPQYQLKLIFLLL